MAKARALGAVLRGLREEEEEEEEEAAAGARLATTCDGRQAAGITSGVVASCVTWFGGMGLQKVNKVSAPPRLAQTATAQWAHREAELLLRHTWPVSHASAHFAMWRLRGGPLPS